ncbi:hypothetical protein [Actinacidiphila sp. ITFR-21]|uniref:hypothetical protein n=1 Tax=Actinacidiphila sp. ITFR-21 TaxID=3075199 RepID=UPI002888F9D9|nr:hypothetical protein [Streptomyces sp. ITFR-21]WNI14556.1 hypothetical protein RLT57_02715 [Streptomyces sp. ITFR-21]
MTEQLFSDPEHVEPVRAPGARPSADPFHVPAPDAAEQPEPQTPRAAEPRH